MQNNIRQQVEVNGTEVLDHVPEGWRVIGGAIEHPPGLRWIDNRKSRFGTERKRALVPEDVAYDWWLDNT